MFNKSHGFKDLEKSEKESKVKEKFEKVKQFAIKNQWLFLEDFGETDEDYPTFTCLTSIGILVEVSRDDSSVTVDNSDGEFDIEL